MSMPDNTSGQIAAHLLRGWTLLDQVCRECYTPLVRSPSPDRQLLCVKCNRDTTLTNGVHPSTSSGSEDILPPVNYHPVVDGDQMDSDEEEQEAGVMQDDPTAIPVLATECVLPATSLLTVVSRREQSDRASKLIGERLLQGYCLLDEICPTTTCYGVPLLRLPRESVRRLCVICQKIYPEVSQPTPTVIQPHAVTLPPIQTIQNSILPITSGPLPLSDINSSTALQLVHDNLAKELLRVTSILGQHEPNSADYANMLDRAHRLVDIMQTLKR